LKNSGVKATDSLAFQSRFREIGPTGAQSLAAKFGSPLYIIDEVGLLDRLQTFKNAVKAEYAHSVVAISYKTNPLHGLLSILHQQDVFAEVVSGDELAIARRLGVANHRILFNGPMKTDAELLDAISSGLYLHCDHADEVQRIESIARAEGRVVALGIRLSFPRIACSRFGFEVSDTGSNSEAHAIAKIIIESPWLRLAGLHMQISTNIRDIRLLSEASGQMAAFAQFIKEQYQLELEWLDLGGGLAGITPTVDEKNIEQHPLPAITRYARAVVRPLLAYLEAQAKPPRLFFEPGRTIFEPYGATLMTVVGKRPSRRPGVEGYIVDAGLNVIGDADRFKHPVFACCAEEGQIPTHLFGPSCRERDSIRKEVSLPGLQIGNHLIAYGTGGYSIATANAFVRYRPAAVRWDAQGRYQLLRAAEDLDHVRRLECTDLPAK